MKQIIKITLKEKQKTNVQITKLLYLSAKRFILTLYKKLITLLFKRTVSSFTLLLSLKSSKTLYFFNFLRGIKLHNKIIKNKNKIGTITKEK